MPLYLITPFPILAIAFLHQPFEASPFSIFTRIACGAEHGDREVVKRHGDHFGVLLRAIE
jgi:hypothetical protein